MPHKCDGIVGVFLYMYTETLLKTPDSVFYKGCSFRHLFLIFRKANKIMKIYEDAMQYKSDKCD